MQSSSKLRTALKEGRQTMGMWQMIPNSNVSRLLARTGADWVCVDCEHGNIDGEKDSPSLVLVLIGERLYSLW